MKTCGYCGRTYDDSQPRCPSCGSTLLKHSYSEDPAATEYNRIKKEIEDKWKSRSRILIGIVAAVVLVLIIIIVSIVAYVNNPQQGVDSNAKGMYESALSDYNTGNYDAALSTLNSIDASWSDYNKVISLRQKAVSEMLREKANNYMENGDYEAIIRLITTNVENTNSDPEIRGLYDSAASSYREQVMADAEQALSNNGYQSAIAVINDGLSVLPSDAILQAEKERYATYEPVNLTSLTPFATSGVVYSFTDGATDTMGNHYNSGFYGSFSKSGLASYANEECSLTWDIGGKYNKLTAIGIVFDSSKGSSSVASYRIWGDGILLYEKDNITSDTKPYEVEVDITGVTDLKLEMYGQGNLYSGGMRSVLVDVMVQKTR